VTPKPNCAHGRREFAPELSTVQTSTIVQLKGKGVFSTLTRDCLFSRATGTWGFTLIEMLVVLMIIGLLVGLVTAVTHPDDRTVLEVEAQRLATLLDFAAAIQLVHLTPPHQRNVPIRHALA